MDKHLLVASYTQKNVNYIINDIKTRFLNAGYDITNVNCTTVVDVQFNYVLVSKVLQQLADMTGYDWYVDELKKIYFFLKQSLTAPFGLTDTNGNYYYNSLILNNDIKSMRNSITVRGGTYLGNLMSEKINADGIQTTFLQAYAYSTVFVKVATVTQTIGIDGIDDPTLFNCLYNFTNQSVIFPLATTPTVGQSVEVGGYPNIPVIVKLKDSVSVNTYGEFEFLIVDNTLTSKASAIARAQAEINQYGATLNQGSFDTKSTGLDVGQAITIQSTIRGVNDTYIINKIVSKLTNGQEFKHSIVLITSKQYGVIEFFEQLFMGLQKQVTINPNEVLDFITELDDTFGITDATPTASYTSGPYVWDTALWGFSVWG
jgi:hypothetical protein